MQQADHVPREGLRVVGDQEVNAVLDGEPLAAD